MLACHKQQPACTRALESHLLPALPSNDDTRLRGRLSWSPEGKRGVNKMQINLKWTQSGNETDAGTGSVAEGQSAATSTF